MTLLFQRLGFGITHISSLVESCLLLIGSLLVLIPIYHFLTMTSKHTLKNFSLSCIDTLGLENVMLYPYRTTANRSKKRPHSKQLCSVSSPVAKTVTDELNSPIDTQVCLLQESSSSMVAGLVNIGNTCFLNSVLQVSCIATSEAADMLNVRFLDLVIIVIAKITTLFGSNEHCTLNIQNTCYAVPAENLTTFISTIQQCIQAHRYCQHIEKESQPSQQRTAGRSGDIPTFSH